MNEALWYLGRGTGVVSLLLLTVVLALGVATTAGRPILRTPRFVITAVHRNASLLASTFLLIHVTTLLFDPYAQLRLLDLVLPFNGTYQPFWLGLGTTALDLLIALITTSLLRHRIGLRGWKALHWIAYLAWPIALLHALGTGTDASTWWLAGLAALSLCTVLAAVAYRLWSTAPDTTETLR